MKLLLNTRKKFIQILPLWVVKTLGQRQVLRGDNHHVKRFVIFSHQRCGSTLLISTLKSHPNIHCYSEVFNRAFPMLFTEGIDHHSPWVMGYRERDPLGFLNQFIFDSYSVDINAVGFKIFPEHFDDYRFLAVVDHLISDPDVVLFHLRRQSKLAILVSLKRAQKTGIWSNPNGQIQKVVPIQLSVAECESFFKKMEAEERRVDDMLQVRKDVYQLVYEDFVSDISESFLNVQQILGVKARTLEISLKKQNMQKIADSIVNFDELKLAFADSRWADYFNT